MKLKQHFVIIFVVVIFLVGLGFLVPSPVEKALAQTADPVFVGAGDIANCSGEGESTAQLLDNIAGTVFTVGDNVYPDGTLDQFTNCYGPTWGRHKDRTRPSPGNHDYHTLGAAGYYTYFGAVASPLDAPCTSDCKGYYSYNLGDWHIIALNSEIDHAAGSVQEQWLRADLAANQTSCTLAYWHKPRFSSGANHGNNSSFHPFWQALYEYGADVVLNGHDHEYERFAPQSPSAQAEPTRGIREFVVGMGGAGLYSFTTPQPNSEVRESATWGVLKLTLHATSYDWEFVPIAGQTFTDTGSDNCVTLGPTPTITDTPTKTSTPTPGPSPTPTATASRTPTPVTPPPTVTSQVISSADDAEEDLSGGSANLTSSDLELGADGGVNQWVGMRFNNITIPRNATILNAYVEFEVDETGSDPTSVLIQAQASDNALAFSATTGNIATRPRTLAQVAWNNIPEWTVTNAKFQTPNLSSIVQEVVNRSGWNSGNSIAIIINGTGRRTAEAYDGEIPAAPKLVITYATGPTPTPTVTATPSQTSTPTMTFTPSNTPTPSDTPTPTFTPTDTKTPTITLTPSDTPIASATPSRTPTSTSTPTSNPELIFANGFESGNLTAWTSNANDGGDLSVNASAALLGSYGLRTLIDDNNAIYVTNDSPNAETRYRARFYFDPNSISMGNSEDFYILYGYSGSSTVVLRIEFRFSSGAYQLRTSLRNDSSSWTQSSWFTISNAPHFIEIDWRASTGSGANNGGLTFWIDGTQRANIIGSDNDTRRIDRVRLGAISGINSGTRGTLYFDQFESRRLTYIGP